MSNKRREVYQLAFYYNVSEIDYLSYLITVIYQVPLASGRLNKVQSVILNLSFVLVAEPLSTNRRQVQCGTSNWHTLGKLAAHSMNMYNKKKAETIWSKTSVTRNNLNYLQVCSTY